MSRQSMDSSGTDLHVYGEGLGPPSIALPADLDWVSLTPAETSKYRQLRILLGDVDFAVSILTRLLDDWSSSDFATNVRDPERDDHRARWNAALVAYTRAFLSGVGGRLDAAMFQGDAADLHATFIRLRNRHVAHSVSDYERVGVLIGFTRDDSQAIEGFLDYLSTEEAPARPRVEKLLKLASLARQALRNQLADERRRLLAYSRAISQDIRNRPRIGETPTAPFGADVPVRRK